jgi:hypothetical protein
VWSKGVKNFNPGHFWHRKIEKDQRNTAPFIAFEKIQRVWPRRDLTSGPACCG